MKSLARRIATLGVAAATIVGMAACSGSKSSGSSDSMPSARVSNVSASTPAWTQDHSQGTLSWYIDFDWFTDLSYGNDTVTKQMLKDTGTTVKWSAGNDDKLNTMIASNQLPCMLTVPVNSAPMLAIEKSASKIVWPLDDLANKYDPYFLKASDGAQPDTVKWYTHSDGHFYGYPSYSLTSQDYKNPNLTGTSAFLVRKDIYKAIGSPDMTTPTGFLNALKLAKQKYPNIIPFSSSSMANGSTLTSTLQNFLAIPNQVNGQYYDRNTDPEYLKWVETLREAHAGGLMSDDDFADTTGDKFNQNLDQNKYFAVLGEGIPQMAADINKAAANNPSAAYIAIDAMQNSKKAQPQLTQTGISGWTVTYITKSCSDPERAIELMQYLVSNTGMRTVFFGTEGQTYTMKNGVPTLLPAVAAMQLNNNDKFNKIYRLTQIWMLGNDMYKIRLGIAHSSDTPVMQQIYAWTKGKMYPNFATENEDPTGNSIQARDLANINNQWASTIVGMIRANSQSAMNSKLQAWETFRNNNQWNSIVSYRNQVIQQNLKRLG